jgi:succinyl-diaminopimelate desuccinylase
MGDDEHLALLEKNNHLPRVMDLHLILQHRTSNKTYNKIPDTCEVMLDIRYIPEQINTIVKDIKKLLPKVFSLEIIMKEPAQFVEDNNAYIKKLQVAGKSFVKKGIPLYSAQGSSDARHYTRVGCDAVEFGPLGKGMGTDNEWVDIKSLKTYYQILEKFLHSIG